MEITQMNIKQVLEEIGYKLQDWGDFWRTNALYRGGKNPNSLSIYKDSGVWVDFGSGTEEYFPFLMLVQKTLGNDNPNLLKYYSKNIGFGIPLEKEEKALLKEERLYPDSCLSKLLPHYDFYTGPKKGISVESLKRYEGGLATSGKFYQRFVFPIRNQNNRIHGFSGRTMVGNQIKWLHIGKKGKWIYPYFNLDEVRESIEEKREVFLVESIGDSLSMFERGIKNHLVAFGLSLSPKLISFISFLDVDKIYFSFNNNERANLASVKNIIKCSAHVNPNKLWLTPPTKEDFGDMLLRKDFDLFRETTECSRTENVETIKRYVDELLKDNTSSSFQKGARSFIKKIHEN